MSFEKRSSLQALPAGKPVSFSGTLTTPCAFGTMRLWLLNLSSLAILFLNDTGLAPGMHVVMQALSPIRFDRRRDDECGFIAIW